MKLIFLDIDGVLNSERHCKEVYDKYGHCPSCDDMPFDLRCLKHFKTLVEKSGAFIVVSSTWRLGHLDNVKGMLNALGILDKYIGKTPCLWTERGNEIQKFLDDFTEPVESFVILDDDTDMLHLMPHLVKTTWQKGFEKKHIKQALEMLGGSL